MLIKKSQTILKHFIGLKFSVWFNAQGSENETMWHLQFFQVDCRSRFSRRKGKEERGKQKEERGRRKEEGGRRKEERGKRKEEALKKLLIVPKRGFVFWAQRKPNAKLDIR